MGIIIIKGSIFWGMVGFVHGCIPVLSKKQADRSIRSIEAIEAIEAIIERTKEKIIEIEKAIEIKEEIKEEIKKGKERIESEARLSLSGSRCYNYDINIIAKNDIDFTSDNLSLKDKITDLKNLQAILQSEPFTRDAFSIFRHVKNEESMKKNVGDWNRSTNVWMKTKEMMDSLFIEMEKIKVDEELLLFRGAGREDDEGEGIASNALAVLMRQKERVTYLIEVENPIKYIAESIK